MPRHLEVSVAMCTYNGAAHVVAQLESILSGTRRPDEIVVVDDASRDATVAMVRGILESDGIDHRIEINSPRLGVTRNFERATSLCRGDVIVLSDQDDWWYPDRLAAAVDVFESEDDILLIHGDARIVDGALRDKGETLLGALEVSDADRRAIRDGEAFPVYLRRNLATGATTSFRQSLLKAALPFPEDWLHDEWLAILASATGRVRLEQRALVAYRQHGANQVGVRRLSLFGKIARALAAEPGRNARLAHRAAELSERLAAISAPAPFVEAALAKSRFEARRARQPRSRVKRVPVVLREALRGDYARFASQGTTDVVRDLLQKR